MSPSNPKLPTIAGISLPDSALSMKALAFARECSAPVVLNHVLRSYAFGKLVAHNSKLKVDDELFFVSAVLHDLGLTERFAGSERFEVVGADAAVRFLESEGVAEGRRAIVWDAIALHTQVGIASRKQPEIALVHIGAGMDVLGLGIDMLPPALVSEIVEAWPRLDLKREFLEILVRVIKGSQQAVPHTWMMDIAREHVHGFHCPSFTELMRGSAFAE